MYYISESQVNNLVSIKDAIDVMEKLFLANLETKENSLSRQIVNLNNLQGLTLFMPALHNKKKFLGIKVSSIRLKNKGLPIINGLYLLIDYVTGLPKAIIDSNAITKLRTAAVSALVTKTILGTYAKEIHNLCVIGAGVQSLAHIEALCKTLFIDSVKVYSRTTATAKELIEKVKNMTWAPRLINDSISIKNALTDSTILCVCTSKSSIEPLIQNKDLPYSLLHINAIGGSNIKAIEIDPEIYSKADVIVESINEAIQDSGEIRSALKNSYVNKLNMITVSNLLHKNYITTHSISLYRSVGIALEDLFLAEYIYEKSIIKVKD